jgi:FkbM family methyltransferase
MHIYRSNKIRTASEIVQRVENWPEAFFLRIFRRRRGLRLLRFRDGVNIVCRGNCRDWDVIHELAFAGGYASAFRYLGSLSGPVTVLDLGGNLGVFSLLAARSHCEAIIHAYEPGPPNFRLFEINRLLNKTYSDRITLFREAVAGESSQVEWFFDEENPGGSGLYATKGKPETVNVTSFRDAVARVGRPLDLVKIDIEGAEFDLITKTPESVWSSIKAISLELHQDPSGQMSQQSFLTKMHSFGFESSPESVCSWFLQRRKS